MLSRSTPIAAKHAQPHCIRSLIFSRTTTTAFAGVRAWQVAVWCEVISINRLGSSSSVRYLSAGVRTQVQNSGRDIKPARTKRRPPPRACNWNGIPANCAKMLHDRRLLQNSHLVGCKVSSLPASLRREPTTRTNHKRVGQTPGCCPWQGIYLILIWSSLKPSGIPVWVDSLPSVHAHSEKLRHLPHGFPLPHCNSALRLHTSFYAELCIMTCMATL